MALARWLQTIRAIGVHPDFAREVHQTRLVRLAREGARYSPQFLQRFSPERRYATLVAFLLETSANLTDEAIELHDRLIGQYHNQSRQAPRRSIPAEWTCHQREGTVCPDAAGQLSVSRNERIASVRGR